VEEALPAYQRSLLMSSVSLVELRPPLRGFSTQVSLIRIETRNEGRRHQMRDIARRAHLAEFGIVAPVGRKGVEDLLQVVARFKRQTSS
jgi:hypothetical protein